MLTPATSTYLQDDNLFNPNCLHSRYTYHLNLPCLSQICHTLYTRKTVKSTLRLGWILCYLTDIAFSASDTLHSHRRINRSVLSRPCRFSASRGPQSNASSKSIKAIHRSFFFAWYFSCSWRTMKIASVMLRPCHESKLHAVNFYNLSHSPFNHSFQNLHCMLQQLYAPVWAACQYITLALVNIHHKNPAPILWYFTNLHHSITHCRLQPSINQLYAPVKIFKVVRFNIQIYVCGVSLETKIV